MYWQRYALFGLERNPPALFRSQVGSLACWGVNYSQIAILSSFSDGITRKSSFLNARGIPSAQQVLAILLCLLTGGVPHPFLDGRGYPSSPWRGYPSSLKWEGTPSSPGWVVPHPVLNGGYPIQSWMRGSPIQAWVGGYLRVPPSVPGMGVPPSIREYYTPPFWPGMGYLPCPDLGKGYPPILTWDGIPPSL